ncbi:MAG: DUF4260 domain-containing protein [Xanthobacteraceae bacterium]|nr:DUF4260 domain-containing protein [Xanthobacteraceae bacterium]
MNQTDASPLSASPVTGIPKLLLKLEGAALAAASITLYAWSGASWVLFAALLLAPDLGFLGYLAGPRIGAITYNTVHVTALPLALGLAGLTTGNALAQHLALIWLAHIGIDRALGYGLKYDVGFGFTHLGRIGKATDPAI